VLPTMSSLFFALCGLRTFASILLYIGLVMAIAATVLYFRDARAQIAAAAGDRAGPSS
jgi:hypothetical protein